MKEHESFEYLDMKRLDEKNENDRKLIEEYWVNTNEYFFYSYCYYINILIYCVFIEIYILAKLSKLFKTELFVMLNTSCKGKRINSRNLLIQTLS